MYKHDKNESDGNVLHTVFIENVLGQKRQRKYIFDNETAPKDICNA